MVAISASLRSGFLRAARRSSIWLAWLAPIRAVVVAGLRTPATRAVCARHWPQAWARARAHRRGGPRGNGPCGGLGRGGRSREGWLSWVAADVGHLAARRAAAVRRRQQKTRRAGRRVEAVGGGRQTGSGRETSSLAGWRWWRLARCN